MREKSDKTLGQAIDEIITALAALDEGSRSTAVRAACEHLGVSIPLAAEPGGRSSPGESTDIERESPPVPPSPDTIRDIRTLKEEKKPKTSLEMACLVAYYLESLAPAGDRKQSITKADLEKYFKQAEFPLPKRIDQVLIDAKAAGYLDSVKRGTYKLNPVGHNLVVHKLPKSTN